MARTATIFLGAALAALAFTATAQRGAALSESMLEGMSIRGALQEKLVSEASGLFNCQPKCQQLLNSTAYAVNTQGTGIVQGFDTYEYLACTAGCNICDLVIRDAADPRTCFTVCKNTPWTSPPPEIRALMPADATTKGVIEPDKACIFGCIIGLCQNVCQGGAGTGQVEGDGWWGMNGNGCTMKSGKYRAEGFYSQAAEYNFWNAQGGQGGQNDCCSNARSLCRYDGVQNFNQNPNYLRVLRQAEGQCAGTIVPKPSGNNNKKRDEICAWFGQGQCGTAPQA